MNYKALFAGLLFGACTHIAHADGLPRKTSLGAQISIPNEEQRKQTGNSKLGIVIVSTFPGSSADTALKAGDILMNLDGSNIEEPANIGAVISRHKAGDKINARVIRNGKEESLTLTVKEKPADKGDNFTAIYDDVTSNGARLRTIITRPTSAGKHPVVFLIQGIGYSSMDFALASAGPYARILKAFNDKGYVTVRVEKPGLGDSEGGPANTVDYERDLDGFRQGMKSVFSGKYDFIDTKNVLIFGHSMGGCEGPIVASEFPVKAIAVYGTVVRTWEEYTIGNTRRQAILAGQSYSDLDKDIRPFIVAQSLIIGGMEPAEVKTKFPQYASGADTFSPDGKTMSGMPLAFWRQCYKYNYADYWAKLNCKVLSLWGESEFIASQEDHPMIAEIVNKNHPGNAVYQMVKSSDHGFSNVASMQESFAKWGKGGTTMNPAVIDILTTWADGVVAH